VWTEQTLTEAVVAPFGQSVHRAHPLQPAGGHPLQSSDADLAARVTNTVAQTYIENDLDARFQMTRTASAWIQEQMSGLKDKLNQSEQALQSYREKQGMVSVKELPGWHRPADGPAAKPPDRGAHPPCRD
jgi:succinoglycan biosynthesis transport protein ExoP